MKRSVRVYEWKIKTNQMEKGGWGSSFKSELAYTHRAFVDPPSLIPGHMNTGSYSRLKPHPWFPLGFHLPSFPPPLFALRTLKTEKIVSFSCFCHSQTVVLIIVPVSRVLRRRRAVVSGFRLRTSIVAYLVSFLTVPPPPTRVAKPFANGKFLWLSFSNSVLILILRLVSYDKWWVDSASRH